MKLSRAEGSLIKGFSGFLQTSLQLQITNWASFVKQSHKPRSTSEGICAQLRTSEMGLSPFGFVGLFLMHWSQNGVIAVMGGGSVPPRAVTLGCCPFLTLLCSLWQLVAATPYPLANLMQPSSRSSHRPHPAFTCHLLKDPFKAGKVNAPSLLSFISLHGCF